MNQNAYITLEFNRIREMAAAHAKSEEAKARLAQMEPQLSPAAIQALQEETSDGRALADGGFRVPVHSLQGVQHGISSLEKGVVLGAETLGKLGGFLEHGQRMQRFMKNKGSFLQRIDSYALSIAALPELTSAILGAINGSHVVDEASPALKKCRKRLRFLEGKIRDKMDAYVTSDTYADILQDKGYSMKEGQFVLPVKRSHQGKVDGQVVSVSGRGTTAFVQPEAVKKLQVELDMVRAQEEQEVYRILSELTNWAARYLRALHMNMDIMVQYDVVMARGRLSRDMDGRSVSVNQNGRIVLNKVRHPLLGTEAVPLNIVVGEKYRSLVITGPNTGGKTVVLKTAGLAILMNQAGMHVPCAPKSTLPIYEDVLVDIGDGQSIEQSLSTFSAHIQNVVRIVEYARKNTLVILDEIGTGTDPTEGMGLGVSILETLHERGATILATTHFNQIKDFARNHSGFANGSMAFDLNSLRPLYRLDIGTTGESNAFHIALRLGLDWRILNRAHEVSYEEQKNYKQLADTLETQAERLTDRESEKRKAQAKAHRRAQKKLEEAKREDAFAVGDAVRISGLPGNGVVVEGADRKGTYTVLYKAKRIHVQEKRMKKQVDKAMLYPENYDMDVVTKSKSHRKKNNKLRKGKKDVVIEYQEDGGAQ